MTEPFENYYRNVRNDENFLYIYKGNAWGILNMLERNIVVPCVFNRDDDGIEEFNIEKKLIIVYTSHCQAENKYDCKGSTEVYKIFKLDSGKTTIDYFDEYEWLNDNILIRIDNMWGCLNADLEYIVLPVCSDKQSVIDELLYKE